jgi:hypothetical protein
MYSTTGTFLVCRARARENMVAEDYKLAGDVSRQLLVMYQGSF